MSSGLMTLLTDFGLTDPFVGIMKAVIWRRAPNVRLVDLTHAIAPQAVGQASYWLERSFVWLPADTVHLAVVDPGVGTTRAPVVVAAAGHWFVGPDNGLFTFLGRHDPHLRARRIDSAALQLFPEGHTFHGRDVFAPVAAELCAGRLRFEDVGPELAGLAPLTAPLPTQGAGRGHVVVVDHFGNLITTLDRSALSFEPSSVELAGSVVPFGRTYADVGDGELIALFNAFGSLEIAQRNGSAARTLGIGPGAEVIVRGSSG